MAQPRARHRAALASPSQKRSEVGAALSGLLGPGLGPRGSLCHPGELLQLAGVGRGPVAAAEARVARRCQGITQLKESPGRRWL